MNKGETGNEYAAIAPIITILGKSRSHYCKRSGFGNKTIVTVSNVAFTVKKVI